MRIYSVAYSARFMVTLLSALMHVCFADVVFLLVQVHLLVLKGPRRVLNVLHQLLHLSLQRLHVFHALNLPSTSLRHSASAELVRYVAPLSIVSFLLIAWRCSDS